MEWADNRGSGIVISVGSGMLMAAMDVMPCCRFGIDLGGGVQYPRLNDWMIWMNRLCSLIVIAGWFSVTDPKHVRAAISFVDYEKLLVYSNIDLGHGSRFNNFGALIENANNFEAKLAVG